eukprot:TRINITY_DN13654_c0_g1_i1.p1 TRINITY_DN13654_c0_g1~~TRINITY_DN13654_c0_g1_i1.p1  ORF type:complete len:528 (-),score=84.95 TRINITY_DN13654_c0_g1_i1:364-1914(-)
MSQPRDALETPWRGVSLGGWLLLEPGPSYPLFQNHLQPDRTQARCEWDLMKVLRKKLGKRGTEEVMKAHRDTHTTKADFERIRDSGLNAVRLPFGYWVVTDPRPNEPYVGAALEYVDLAVDWAEECGLQLVLDLHGCPGGESPEAPCGRRQRPESRWHWKHWDRGHSLKVVEIIAKRYSGRSCVTGFEVCNEPSGSIPAATLIGYYSRAVDRIRNSGMLANQVAVVLPIFQRPEGEDGFIERFVKTTRGRHRNICFDVHCYHCFENLFNGKTFAQQLRAIEENAEMLKKHPMVVGEWSLALGVATWCTAGDLEEETIRSIFAVQQLEALKNASHGSFFWNWSEEPGNKEWNFQEAHSDGMFSREPMQLPSWDGTGLDPLEEVLHPSSPDPMFYYGDTVCLRVFYGRYIEVLGRQVAASWADKGEWQTFTLCKPPAEANSLGPSIQAKCPVRHRDIIRLRAWNGSFLAVDGETVVTTRKKNGSLMEFKVFLDSSAETLRHGGRPSRPFAIAYQVSSV